MLPEPPPPSRLDPLIETLLVALLAFMPAAFGVTEAWSEAIAVAIGGAIALLLAVRTIARGRHEVARPSLAAVAIVVFVAIAAFQLVPLPISLVRAISPQTAEMKTQLLSDLPNAAEVLARQPLTFYPAGTRQDLRVVLLAATVFAAVVTVYRDPTRIRRLLIAVAIIGGAVALLAAAQDMTRTDKIYWTVALDVPARSGPFANHSNFGQFMNLSVGCALALLLPRLADAYRTDFLTFARRTWWLAAIIVLGLVTIALSLTRGGMIAIVASGAVATLVLLATRNLRHMAGAVVVLALGAIGLLFALGIDRVYTRMLEPALGARLYMLRDTLVMIRTFPTFGTGLGAFEWIFPTFDRSFEASTAAYLENEYVQALADTGPLGLAAVALFVAVIATRYLRAIRTGGDDRIGLAAVGLGYGLLAVMVQSLNDFGQHFPAVGCLSAVTCGLLFNLGRPRTERTITVSRRVALMTAGFVLAVGLWAVIGAKRAWRAEHHFARAQRLSWRLADKEWRGTDAEYADLLDTASAAVAAEPDDAYHRYRAAFYRWNWVAAQTDEQTGRPLVNDRTVAAAQRVVDELNQARTACPSYGLAYTLLGQVELKFLGRPIGYDHIEAGWRLARNDPDAAFVAGQADARRGRFDDAARKFDEALRIAPGMVDRVIAVYLDQYNRPELAADAIGTRYLELITLRDALRKRPEWKDLAERAEAKAFHVLDAETRRPGAATWKFAMLAWYRAEHGRTAEAEQLISRALQDEPANMAWRIMRAELLQKLGRTQDALAEAKNTLNMYPAAPEAQALMKRLLGGTTP
jgi:tetratricopeptide (TPR) repeat protein